MSFIDSQDIKERVRQATEIIDLIGRDLQLRRQGRNFVALCPWHDDTKPSLQVNQNRQSWKCWVCDVGGDVFDYTMKRESVNFREALEMLAERAGISLNAGPQPKIQPGSPNDKKTLYNAMAWAEEQFHQYLLQAPEAEMARVYLEDRGITPESIQKFHLGFSPNQFDWLLNRSGNTPFSPAVLEAVGLLRNRGNGHYDFFRGRVIFSVRDTQNRPIAFGGRVLPEIAKQEEAERGNAPAKYFNSPETKLFSKSDQLYGLDLARDSAALKATSDTRELIVTEGYTDTLMAHQAGVDNVVACLGTALGPRHIRLLRRYVDRVTLVLDGDEAGQRRTNEILELFVAEQMDLRILTLPEGLDPCDFLLENGAKPFRDLVGGAVDALEHKVRVATRGVDLVNDTHQANRALEDILTTIAKAPQLQAGGASELHLRQQQMLTRLARQFQLAEGDIRSRLKDIRQKSRLRSEPNVPDWVTSNEFEQPQHGPPSPHFEQANHQTPSRKQQKTSDLTGDEIELLEILAADPQCVPIAIQNIEQGQLKSQAARELYHTIHQIHDEGQTPDFGRVLTALEHPDLKNIWVELDEKAQAKAEEALEDAPTRLQGLIDNLHYEMVVRDQNHKRIALENKSVSPDDEVSAIMQMLNQRREQQGISEPKE